MTNILHISNIADADEFFGSDKGSWNVTKALRDCRAGKYQSYRVDVVEAYAANINVETDGDKVARFIRTPEVFAEPCIGIIENGAMWLIDGHHRLQALHMLGIREFSVWIIEEEHAAQYLIKYNGERMSPFDIKGITS